MEWTSQCTHGQRPPPHEGQCTAVAKRASPLQRASHPRVPTQQDRAGNAPTAQQRGGPGAPSAAVDKLFSSRTPVLADVQWSAGRETSLTPRSCKALPHTLRASLSWRWCSQGASLPRACQRPWLQHTRTQCRPRNAGGRRQPRRAPLTPDGAEGISWACCITAAPRNRPSQGASKAAGV